MEMKKPRLAMIATYPKMAAMFTDMAEEMGIYATNAYASFNDAVRIGRDMENDVDAFISRGGTGMLLKSQMNKPVINVPITPFDVLRGLQELEGSDVSEVAFIHAEKIGNLRDVEEMTGIKIHEYFFNKREDIMDAVYEIKNRHIGVVIGGRVGAKYAEQYGMRGIEISAGEDSLRRAIMEALHILELNEIERLKSARVRAAFDSISEGIIVADADGDITVMNERAEDVLRRKEIQPDYFDQIKNEVFRELRSGKTGEQSRIITVGKERLAITYKRIETDGTFEGGLATFENVSKIQKLETKIRSELHKKGFVAKYRFTDIVGSSAGMKEVCRKASLYATSNSNILIEGESGTGKELIAQSIHSASSRADGPFVAVNCAAIPANLLESELFGYEGGAFTGASKEGKQGLFEMAHGGTLFLDEIGELPLELQSRILRVLQEREVMRIGGNRIIPIDIRILSATNRNLRQMVEDKTFREDLYYRLNVFNVEIPPLRNRKEDILPLLRHFLNELDFSQSDENTRKLCQKMMFYDWPGNIRELQNVAERIAVLSEMIDFDLLDDSGSSQMITDILGLVENKKRSSYGLTYSLDNGLKGAVSDIEKQIINDLLEEFGNDQDAVAEKLKIGRTTLWRKAKGDTSEQ